MRTKDILSEVFNDIGILHEYLFSDNNHTVKIVNNFGILLEVGVYNKRRCWMKIINHPEIPIVINTSILNIENMISIVEQLKNQPLTNVKKFKSMWDEIKEITKNLKEN